MKVKRGYKTELDLNDRQHRVQTSRRDGPFRLQLGLTLAALCWNRHG